MSRRQPKLPVQQLVILGKSALFIRFKDADR